MHGYRVNQTAACLLTIPIDHVMYAYIIQSPL